MARTEQQLNAEIRQQDIAYGTDRDTVLRAANGDLARGIRPATVDQLTAMSPQVSDAWNRLQVQQPEVAHQVATRLLSENAKETTGDAKTYGPGFFSVFQKIHAPDGDPNKVSDPAQLYSMVGQPDGLTMAGLAKAREEIQAKGTPDGEAETHMRTQFFKDAHGQITGTDDGLGSRTRRARTSTCGSWPARTSRSTR